MKKIKLNRTLVLYFGMLLNVILGFGIAKLNTAYLSVELFGMLSLFINLVLFLRVFFSLGVFESASRLLATEKNYVRRKSLFGATLLYTLFLGFALNLLVLAASFVVDSIFKVKINDVLRIFWPLSFVLLFQNMLLIILRGFGYIKRMSLFYFLSRLVYIILLAALAYLGIFQLNNTIFSFLISILISALIFVIWLKPSFSGLKHQLKILYHEILSYGRHLYVANIISAFFQHIDKLLLAYFLDAKQLGYYALAYTITAPMPYFSNALSTTAFRNFANNKSIQTRKLWINFAYVSLATIFLVAFNQIIIEGFFSKEFSPARPALTILTLAFAFKSLSIPYTMFFKAKKFGKEIKNIALITQAIFLISSIIFIPIIGIEGAALALLIAFSLDYVFYFGLYKNKIRKL